MKHRNCNWHQRYWDAIPTVVDTTKYRSIADFLETILEKYNTRIMCENMGKGITYQKMNELSKDFAAYFQNYTDLKIGSHVAIQLPNLLQYVVALLGLLRAGMVVVNINPMYTKHEMLYQLKDANVTTIIVLENFAYKLVSILPKTSIKTIIISKTGDLFGSISGETVNFIIKYIKKLVPAYQLPNTLSFKKVLKEGGKTIFKRINLEPDHIAFLQYTGGTTGISKGTILTHGNIMATMAQLEPFLHFYFQKGENIITIIPLPLYHIFALIVLFSMFFIGAKNILITNPKDMHSFVKELKRHRFSCLIGVNSLFKKLLSDKKFVSLDFSYLKITLGGGIKTQQVICRKWESLTGNTIVDAYGLTEASCATLNVLDKIGQGHLPLPNTTIKIVNEKGEEVPCGIPGELLIKGPQVMKEYWNNPKETSQIFLNGYLKTGDIALINKEGYMHIIDRKKDMINVSGFNVYPSEIEHIVNDHPKVLEVSAVGITDRSFQEAVKIFVVKKNPTLTAEELTTYCRTKLAPYKIPKYIEFKDSLPKSQVGKVLKKLLK